MTNLITVLFDQNGVQQVWQNGKGNLSVARYWT